MHVFNLWETFLSKVEPFLVLEGISLPYLIMLALGSALLIFVRQWFIQGKQCSFSALEILNASQQEWIYFRSGTERGIASKGLSSYLAWEKPLETLEDFAQALQHKFLFDLTPWLNRTEKNPESFKADIHNALTDQSCELSAIWGSLSRPSGSFIFWLRDTTAFQQEAKSQNQKLASVIQENTRLKEMLDMLPFPIWFRNTQGWLTYCNRFYAEALDCPNEYVTQENALLWAEGKWEDSCLNAKRLQNLTEPLKRHILVQGDRRYFEFKEDSLDGLEGVMGYGLDLTELEKALVHLEQHDMAYQEVLENLSAGVTIYGADKRLKFFNHAYARLFGTDEKWLNTEPSLGEVLDDVQRRRLLAEQADYQSYRKQQLQMVSALISPFQELEHLPDGRTIRRIAAPHPLGGVFFIFEDVTGSLALEQQYNTQLAVHQASLDNLYEGVAVFGSDNRLKLVNPAFIRVWGMDREKVALEQHLSEVVNMIKDFFTFEGSWEDYQTRLISRVTDRVPKKSRLNCKNDKLIDFNYVPLPDGSHLLTCIDVTEKHQSQEITEKRTQAIKFSAA